LQANQPWEKLYRWAETALTIEGQENLASLMLEPYGYLVDDLAGNLSDRSAPHSIDGAMSVGAMREHLARRYDWAISIDWEVPENQALAWYVSAEKLEPRLGEKVKEQLEPFELPLAPCRDAATLFAELDNWPNNTSIADFLLRHPEHRHMVRRVQRLENAPYGEIHGNTVSSDVFPVDMLRFKLGVFGATHFDPRSDRWVRITMFGNAPFPEELTNRDADFWPYPEQAGEGA
jgi:hypothetical protein